MLNIFEDTRGKRRHSRKDRHPGFENVSVDFPIPSSVDDLKEMDPALYTIWNVTHEGAVDVEVTLGFEEPNFRYSTPQISFKVVSVLTKAGIGLSEVPSGEWHIPSERTRLIAEHGKEDYGYWHHDGSEATEYAWLRLFAETFYKSTQAFTIDYKQTYQAQVEYVCKDEYLDKLIRDNDLRSAYLYRRFKMVKDAIVDQTNRSLPVSELRGLMRDLDIKHIPSKLSSQDQFEAFALWVFETKKTNLELSKLQGTYAGIREVLRPTITGLLAQFA